MYLLLSYNYCFVADALHLETTFLIEINFLDSRPVVQFHLGSTAALNKPLIFGFQTYILDCYWFSNDHVTLTKFKYVSRITCQVTCYLFKKASVSLFKTMFRN